jgi:hypothetical protein
MKYYNIIPYSHRQEYLIKKELKKYGVHTQAGSGWADALSKIGSVAGKIASNPAVQNLASSGLEVGTAIAGNVLANKLAQNPNVSNAISTVMQNREEIKQLYKSGELTKNQALDLLKKLQTQSGGVKSLKTVAKHQYGRGHVMSVRPVKNFHTYDPVSINRAGGLQTGGVLPLIPLALGSAGIGLLGSILNPIVERLSSKYVANNIK